MTSDATSEPPLTGRVSLALLAGQAIARTPGVTATAGPAGRWQTVGPQLTIPGVVAAESADGGVQIDLHLVARWPPQTSLQQLADQLRARLRRSAAMAGMGDRLGAVSVAFDDVLTERESI